MAKAPRIKNDTASIILHTKVVSRFYLKGLNFSAATTITVAGQNVTTVRYKAPYILIGEFQFVPGAYGTGEVDVTITVTDPASTLSSDALVPVYVDDGM